MPKVHVLDKELAELIAAGEVIKDLTHFDREHR